MLKFFSKFLTLAVLLIVAPCVSVFAQDEGGTTEEEMTLQELLDSFKFGVDDYAYGSAPGYVGDKAVYEEFFNTYTDALQMASNTSATDEEKAEMCKKLKASKEKVEAAINPVADGTYYIETACSFFAEKDTMAWFAPYEGNYPGWKAKKPQVLFMWNVKKLPSGNYSIQSVSTGQYVFHNDVIDGQETNMYMTDTQQFEQVFENITPNGQFNIHCEGAQWTYNIQHHNQGNAISGPIGNWSDKNVSSEGAWRLVPVSAADLAAAEATKYTDLLAADVAAFKADGYTFGTDPGQYSKALFDAFQAEHKAAKEMLEDTENAPTEEACKAEYEKYTAAKKALDGSLVEVTDGYYSISTNTYANVMTGQTANAWTAKNGYLYSFGWETFNPAYIWKITKLENGNYTVQSKQTGEYVNTTDLYQQGASIGLSKTPRTDILITRNSGEKFNFTDAASRAAGFGYATATELVWVVGGNGTDLYLHKFTDEEVAAIETSYPQKLRTDTLRNLIAETSKRASVDSIYTIDLNSPIVSDKSQLFITNQSTEGEDLGNLLDNNFETFCISGWNESVVNGTAADDYHAIRVDAGEGKTLPRNLGWHWRTRGSSWSNQYRPIWVKYYASNDLQNWDYIGEAKNPEADFPVVAEKPEFTSSQPVIMDKPYRYLNMKVIQTNTHDKGFKGYEFFTFSEFNAYPMTAEINPALDDPEILQAVQGLKAAIAAAQAKVDANNGSSQDIQNLKDVYNEFLLVWKDTTDICRIYKLAKNFSTIVAAGEDPFYFPSDKVDEFETAFAEVDNAYPFEDLKQREIARLDTLLTRAYNKVVNSMIGPDPNTWYYVICADDETTVDDAGNTYKGKFAYMGGYSASDGLGCGGLEGNMKDLRRVWKFTPTDRPNVYNMVCAANGWPINRSVVRLAALGEGQFEIYTNSDLASSFFIQRGVLPGVPSNGDASKVNGRGAWTIQEIDPDHTRLKGFTVDKVFAMVNPFDTDEMPSAYTEGHSVMTYQVCGYEVGDDGKTITGINLTEMMPDEDLGGIPAGTPFVMVIDGDQPYDGETLVQVDLHPKHGGNLTHEATTVNGLGGVFGFWWYDKDMLYFQDSTACVHNSGAWRLDPLDAYLDQTKIVNDPEASVDKVIPVKGTVEILNGISAVVEPRKTVVNVYTADGVLVRKNVKVAGATKGLAKGVYIVGKNKVLVK